MMGNADLGGDLTPDLVTEFVGGAAESDLGVDGALPSEVPMPLAVGADFLLAVYIVCGHLEQLSKLTLRRVCVDPGQKVLEEGRS